MRRSGPSHYHEIISTFDDKAMILLRMNLQLTKQMSILINLPVPIGKNEGTPPTSLYTIQLITSRRNAVYMNRMELIKT